MGVIRLLRIRALLLSYIVSACLIGGTTAPEAIAQVRNVRSTKADEQQYRTIRIDFDAGNWKEVIDSGGKFRQQFKRSNRESSIILLMAQSALRLRDIDRAMTEVAWLRLKFASSDYIDDARWVTAECALMAERWDDAAHDLRWILGFSTDSILVSLARERLAELQEFQSMLKMAENHISYSTANRLKLALLLPLTGGNSETAKSFLAGFAARWRTFSNDSLLSYDTERDPVRAVRLARDLIRTESIQAIVGGLEPSEAAALSALAEAERIPFLTTTCGVNGVASISRYAFQGRPDFGGVGTRLARYSISDLGLGKFAVLAPVTQEGRQIAAGFKAEIEYAGGEILAEEAYYPGTMDFKDYFARIRSIGLRRAYDDTLRNYYFANGFILRDSVEFYLTPKFLQASKQSIEYELSVDEDTTWTLSDDFLDSLWTADHETLREWIIENEEEIDSLEIPLSIIDGFLFVIEPDQVQMAAPQFARANIHTQLLGGELWGDRDAILQVSNYINGLIFADPLTADGGKKYYEFVDTVTKEDEITIDQFVMAGERAAAMMIFAADGSKNSEDVRRKLSQIRDLETLSGKVSLLKEERVDRRVRLVRFVDGSFEVIED